MTEEDNNEVLHLIETEDSSTAVQAVTDIMDRLLETAGVEKVFGPPLRKGEFTVIPAAEILAGVGFGVGFGGGTGVNDENEEVVGEGSGGGGGGGGRTFARPVAVIVIGPDDVRVEPIIDRTKIALTALTAIGFVFGLMAKMRRGEFGAE